MKHFIYQSIKLDQLKLFSSKKIGERFQLSLRNCPNKILIKLPFILDEKVATLAGLMPDGSLIKDIRRIYFGQKKDIQKVHLFKDLLNELFELNNKIFIRTGAGVTEAYTNSTVLCNFLYSILDFKKSDEEMRAPVWVFDSPNSVKRAYLREAFAMEGTVRKSLREITFVAKSYDFCNDIKDLLLDLGINSFLKAKTGGTYGGMYRVSVYRKENFEKFKKIGFTAPLHVERFGLICKKYGI